MYGIRLTCKYTGEHRADLGSQFATRQQAADYAAEHVCTRCHRVDIINIGADAVWQDRKIGFKPAVVT